MSGMTDLGFAPADVIRVVVVIGAACVVLWFAAKQRRTEPRRDRCYSPRYRGYTLLPDELAYMSAVLDKYLALLPEDAAASSDEAAASLRQIAADTEADLRRMHYDPAMFFEPEVAALAAQCKALFLVIIHPDDYHYPKVLNDGMSPAAKARDFSALKNRLEQLLAAAITTE